MLEWSNWLTPPHWPDPMGTQGPLEVRPRMWPKGHSAPELWRLKGSAIAELGRPRSRLESQTCRHTSCPGSCSGCSCRSST